MRQPWPMSGRQSAHWTPSKWVGHLILVRGLFDVAHYGLFRYLNDRDPVKARSWAIGSAVVAGGVVALNVRYAF